jgi:hypothetical protein
VRIGDHICHNSGVLPENAALPTTVEEALTLHGDTRAPGVTPGSPN